jgi:hypothetical protein
LSRQSRATQLCMYRKTYTPTHHFVFSAEGEPLLTG